MKLELLDYTELDSFPSAAGIEYYDGHIYINGEDATRLLVSDTRWKKPDTIILEENGEDQVTRPINVELEASAMVELEGRSYLLLLGSGSDESKNKGVLFDIQEGIKRELDLSGFYNRLRTEYKDLNIEGVSQISNQLVLSNRGSVKNPANQFILTSVDFFRYPSAAPIEAVSVKRPPFKGSTGISGIAYSERHDLMLFTTSSENETEKNNNQTSGDSSLGVIENAYWKMGRRKIKINEMIDLPSVDKRFKNLKFESVCIQSTKKRSVKMQLAGKSTEGKSFLFKAVLDLK